jgi:hypothetical protein
MTWFFVSLSFVGFIVVNWAFLPEQNTIFWSILFIGRWSFEIILFVFATLAERPLPSNLNPDHSRYRDFCQNEVPLNAKHCRRCNRCRCGFTTTADSSTIALRSQIAPLSFWAVCFC